MQKKYLILAYYHLAPIENPELFVKEHKKFFKNLDIKCRIYISNEGINGQLSGLNEHCQAYMDWLKKYPEFEGVWFKIDSHHENIFFKQTVKVRDQLVAFDQRVDLSKRGAHISPEEWRAHLEGKRDDYILIDVRNDYETKVGHFEGSELPTCQTFRDFKAYTEQELIEKKKLPKDKKILMCCTGGIRCEYYSAYMKEKGFENVHQLEGGIINYAHSEGGAYWKGKLFVFDDRLVENLSPLDDCISNCHHCSHDEDCYYNCANMDCNELFICCKSCLEEFKGCCSKSCMSAQRVRPYNHISNKPFRKWYYYTPEAAKS